MVRTAVTILAVAVPLLAWYFSAVPRNLSAARKSGLPYIFCPVTQNNPFWLLFVSIVGYTTLQKWTPAAWFEVLQLTIPGYEFRVKHQMFQRLGDAFILVAPGTNTLYCGDASMGYDILARRKDFVRLETAAKIMRAFGQNLLSSDHDEWQRQRKIVAPTLNERIMEVVWVESRDQAGDMLSAHVNSKQAGDTGMTNEIMEGMKRITINVIGLVGYGARRSWNDQTNAQHEKGFSMLFMTSLLVILDRLFVAIFVPAELLTRRFMPKSFQVVGKAKQDFAQHLNNIIADERKQPTANNTLITKLIRLADEGAVDTSSKTSAYLLEEEISGNLFGFTIAGFDTTANTLTYCVMALAIHPEWQDWITENIDAISEDDYETAFPNSTRCLALMYEALRLFTPVAHIVRNTAGPQDVKNYYIAADTQVQVALQSIHTQPEVWGTDSTSFRPDRWISGGKAPCETFLEPPKGAFMPWSSGPRFCPGLKMAQVEFVSVIRSIFGKWRVEVVREDGESLEQAQKRLKALVADSSPRLTMQMNKPEDAWVRWTPRESSV